MFIARRSYFRDHWMELFILQAQKRSDSIFPLLESELWIEIVKIFYVSFMVITKEKPVVDIQKIKIKELKYTTKNHQITREGSKRGKRE